jgi:DNA-binding transcriptional regulator YhcF (GntR family)
VVEAKKVEKSRGFKIIVFMNLQNTNESPELPGKGKNATWQRNHRLIAEATRRLIRQNDCVPTKVEIAEEAGLNINTVYKHLEEFDREGLLADTMEQVRLMAAHIVGKVLSRAMAGDMKASKLSLQVMGFFAKKTPPVRKKENGTEGKKPPSY